MPVCDVSTIGRMLRSVAAVVILILCVRVGSEICRIFPRDQSLHLRTQQRGSTEKSGLRDVS